jgi:WD40 repeat protein
MTTNKVQLSHIVKEQENPFPGLRAFGVDESHLFFGREGQSEIVLEYLALNRFAAVTGASGSGKSSLIYCGLVPILYGGFILSSGSTWRIIATRPGNQPIINLAEAINDSEADSKNFDLEKQDISRNIIYANLRRSSFGLIDVVAQMNLKRNENLLLVIDQFEELFRFKESRDNITTTLNETEAYIKLLVNAIHQRSLPIYIVLTMRSDFIGECSQFQELTRLINQSNYLVPQMTREDFSRAITGPIAVSGNEIDAQLLQQILNSIAEGTDQLPVLQHTMMRTWEFWHKYNEIGTPLRLRDYDAAGKMENALSMHANEAYETLTEEGKRICKSMFKTLTEKSTDNKGIRHPATVKEIANVAQAGIQDVLDVINVFRSRGRSFLTPTEGTELNELTVIDISHESLMRVWDRLKGWVEEETNSVQLYLRLSEAASLYQLGKTGLWRPPDLQLALNWKKTQQPSLAWAKKYNPAFEKVMVFLDASEKKFLQEEQNKVKLQRRTLSRTRRFATVMGVTAIAFLGLMFYAYSQKTEADKLRKGAEMYASVMEQQKDYAVEETNVKEIERLKAMHQKDSVERARMEAMLQLTEVKEEVEHAKVLVTEVTKQSEVFQKTSNQAQIEKQLAEQNAFQAKVEQTKAEKEKTLELKKRILTVAQAIAAKSAQIDDPVLKALLAYQAFQFNRDFQGNIYDPDVYSGLYRSLATFKGINFNSFKGHEGAVKALAFLPDKPVFFSAGADGKILRWDLSYNNVSPQTLIKNNFVNRSLAVSSTGRWLACGTGTSSIQLFNLNQSNFEPIVKEGHKGWVVDIEFIKGKDVLISCSEDKTIMYWDLITNQNKTIASNNTRIRAICLSVDGKLVYGATEDGFVKSWNIENGESKVIYDNKSSSIYAISLNSSGSKLACGDKNGYIILINPLTGKVISRVQGHSARILDLCFSPDNSDLATSSNDGTLRIWNSQDLSSNPVIITEQESWVTAIAFTPDGRKLISSSNNGNLIYYWPTRSEYMTDQMCKFITRNMTKIEWDTYVGSDIEYHKTCIDK